MRLYRAYFTVVRAIVGSTAFVDPRTTLPIRQGVGGCASDFGSG